ncbi:MAG: aspartate aminotransferase family protein, partial [Ancrocorticia sp.]|uniref:aspartate aminotransferase family protein n=1 Tax=Ancrocorticia sp. TaxID=2593684 RepID=UPI003F8ED169
MTHEELIARDAAAIAGVEKLRFFPATMATGARAHLTDVNGRDYVDLTATWTAAGLGYGHRRVAQAVAEAMAGQPGSGLSIMHENAVLLAERLLELVPERVESGTGEAVERRVYLGHAGSDACDVALRCARAATGKRRVVAFQHSYHGGFGLAQSVSGVLVEGGAVPDPDAVFVPYPNPFRPHAGTIEESVDDALAQVSTALDGGDVAIVAVEPILSDGGFVVPPAGFLRRLADLVQGYGVLLMVDEVKMGLARPGLMHTYQHEGITPDIVCFGKSLGGGLPIGAAVGPAWVLNEPPASALLTMAGNSICTAAALAVLDELVEGDYPGRTAQLGQHFMSGLRGLQEGGGVQNGRSGGYIGDVRGHGLCIGLELVEDRASNAEAFDLTRKVIYRMWQLGVLV